jgi:hypothetical protein
MGVEKGEESNCFDRTNERLVAPRCKIASQPQSGLHLYEVCRRLCQLGSCIYEVLIKKKSYQ